MRHSHPKMLVLIAIAAAVFSGSLGSTANAADQAGLTFTDGSTSQSNFTRGWEFSTSTSLTLSSLGWWDSGSDGLADSHQVAIWDTSGNELVSATVASGTTDALVSGFRFDSSLSGTASLPAGTYIIGGLSTDADNVSYAVPSASLTLAPGISFIQNQSNGASSFSFPNTTQAGLDSGVFGPSFQIKSVPPAQPTGDPVGLTYTGGSLSQSNFTRGWKFSTATAIKVTSLGWFDAGSDGLANSHQVAIWDTSGTQLVSATVAGGTTDAITSGFRFDTSLDGTATLPAGTYIIGGLSTNADDVGYGVPSDSLTLAQGISFIENESNGVSSFSFPDTTQAGLDSGVFGPSFQFQTVPEPASLAAIAIPAALTLLRRRRAE